MKQQFTVKQYLSAMKISGMHTHTHDSSCRKSRKKLLGELSGQLELARMLRVILFYMNVLPAMNEVDACTKTIMS